MRLLVAPPKASSILQVDKFKLYKTDGLVKNMQFIQHLKTYLLIKYPQGALYEFGGDVLNETAPNFLKNRQLSN